MPVLALSGTITEALRKKLQKLLALESPAMVILNPHVPNIFLSKFRKEASSDCLESFEIIFRKEIDALYNSPSTYPVTLIFLPLQYMSSALAYCHVKFGSFLSLSDTVYGALYSRQDPIVSNHVIDQLKSDNPTVRLIFSTSVSGMGFNSPAISRIIHAKPPRNVSQYLQEIGRSGRCGQNSHALLYWCPNDIKSNLPGMQECIQMYCKGDKCLWEAILINFGFKKEVEQSMCRCCDYCLKNCKCASCVAQC